MLTAVFPSVTLYLQNHVGGLNFQPVAARRIPHICTSSRPNPIRVKPTFLSRFVLWPDRPCTPASPPHPPRTRGPRPQTSQDEIPRRDTWLKQHQEDLSKLLAAHTAQGQELAAGAKAVPHRTRAVRSLQQSPPAAPTRGTPKRPEMGCSPNTSSSKRRAVSYWRPVRPMRNVWRLMSAPRTRSSTAGPRTWKAHKHVAEAEHEQFEASRRESLATAQAY